MVNDESMMNIAMIIVVDFGGVTENGANGLTNIHGCE